MADVMTDRTAAIESRGRDRASVLRRLGFSDKIFGSLRLLLSMQVKGVDENVRVEKVLSGAHSSLRA